MLGQIVRRLVQTGVGRRTAGERILVTQRTATHRRIEAERVTPASATDTTSSTCVMAHHWAPVGAQVNVLQHLQKYGTNELVIYLCTTTIAQDNSCNIRHNTTAEKKNDFCLVFFFWLGKAVEKRRKKRVNIIMPALFGFRVLLLLCGGRRAVMASDPVTSSPTVFHP